MVMRSLNTLRERAIVAGINPDGMQRSEIMDALRGAADDMQINPMRAKDLKGEIDWGTANPFGRISRFFDENFVIEPKLDGARMRVFIGAEGTRMNTGRRSMVTYAYIDRSANFPHLAKIKSAKFDGTILDGEVMSPTPHIRTKKGTYTQSALNAAVALVTSDPAHSLEVQAEFGKCIYFAFDVLVWKGDDIQHLSYDDRRVLLEKVMTKLGKKTFRIIPQMPSTQESVIQCLAEGYEGSMIKRRNSPYMSGKRSPHWMKVKTMSTMDAFITGFVPGKGRNEGKIGGVEFSLMGEDGISCTQVGRFGAMDDQLRDEITADPNSYRDRVVEIMGQGKTKHGKIRHPQFVKFRPDKEPSDCLLDQLDHFPEV